MNRLIQLAKAFQLWRIYSPMKTLELNHFAQVMLRAKLGKLGHKYLVS